MDLASVIADFAARPVDAAAHLAHLTPEQLNAHPAGHPNSIAWLLWHSARQVDVQVAELSGTEPLWTRGGYRERFDLGEIGDTTGLGHSEDEARSVVVDDPEILRDYLAAVLGELSAYAATLTADEFDEIVDVSYRPHVSRGVRLVSIVSGATLHVGAAMHVAGVVDLA